MMWTYRLFRDSQGRYSVREVFHERDGTIISYSKTPVAVAGGSIEELMQLVEWFKEAFDLQVLSLEEVDARIAALSKRPKTGDRGNISLEQIVAELATKTEGVI